MSKLRDLLAILFKYPSKVDAFFRRPLDLVFFYPTIFLARNYRRSILRRKRFIVITGSLGKTTTLRAMRMGILRRDHYQSFSNYGFRLGENMLRSRPWEPHDVFEVGISRPNTMNTPAAILRPDVVVVTSIKSDHNRSFPALEDTRAEKVKLVRALTADGLAVLNGDDPNVRWMGSQTKAKVVYYGFGPDCDVRASDFEIIGPAGSRFVLHARGRTWPVTTNLLGEKSIYSVLATAAVALEEGISVEAVLTKLQGLQPAPGRLESVRLSSGAVLIDDSFKGHLESIHVALDTLREIPAQRKIVMMGAVEEPPGSQGPIYRDLGKRIASVADVLLFIKPKKYFKSLRASAIEAGMKSEAISCVEGISDAVRWLESKGLGKDDVFLLKGPNVAKYRRILLSFQGYKVRCKAEICKVKIFQCEKCPLLDQDTSQLDNYFINRLLTHRKDSLE